MSEDCVPFQKKTLYLMLTIPMIGLYIVLAAFLWQVHLALLLVYLALFVVVAVGQSFACVHWQCPYVGRFAPCAGGFCLPSSQIARLFKNATVSARTYNWAVTLAFVAMLGIIVLPTYFLLQYSVAALLLYLGSVVLYAAGFLWLICPACATRQVCPGGQAATKLRDLLSGNR
jgi:hypothetical protein